MIIPTLEQTIERMKTEILADIASGTVRTGVASFSELHDYVDANEYGGFCEDALGEVMIAHFGGRDEHEGVPDAYMCYMNMAQNAIDDWLHSGKE